MENEEQVPQEESVEPKEELTLGPNPTCDAGYYWNATLGKCVLDVG